MKCILHRIRKKNDYIYQSSHFMDNFKLYDDKPYLIRAILGTRSYNKYNYDNAISDIINYYNDDGKINELKTILTDIIPSLEIPKKKKYDYYKNGKYPNSLLVHGSYNDLMRNRITNIFKNL
jgi:hypothetical protein